LDGDEIFFNLTETIGGGDEKEVWGKKSHLRKIDEHQG